MDAKELYLLMEENSNKLDKCKSHDFEKAIPNKEFENEHQYRCKNCEGIVDVIYKNGYCEGLKHSQELTREYTTVMNKVNKSLKELYIAEQVGGSAKIGDILKDLGLMIENVLEKTEGVE